MSFFWFVGFGPVKRICWAVDPLDGRMAGEGGGLSSRDQLNKCFELGCMIFGRKLRNSPLNERFSYLNIFDIACERCISITLFN